MRNVISNAFSISMLSGLVPPLKDGTWSASNGVGLPISLKEISPSDVPSDCISVVGHADTAAILTGMLGFEVPFNRVSFTAQHGDKIYVAQYSGPRLPEGATKLPDGAMIRFYLIEGICIDNRLDDGAETSTL